MTTNEHDQAALNCLCHGRGPPHLERIARRNSGFNEARGANPKKLQLHCPREKPRKCGYTWTYTRTNPNVWITSCPKCKTKVSIKKATEQR